MTFGPYNLIRVGTGYSVETKYEVRLCTVDTVREALSAIRYLRG